jgi:hypothetical protein
MRSFREYIYEIYKESSEKYDLFKKLFDICLEKYTKETKDFFEILANKDEEIRDILEKLKSEGEDVVATNLSDSDYGNEEI